MTSFSHKFSFWLWMGSALPLTSAAHAAFVPVLNQPSDTTRTATTAASDSTLTSAREQKISEVVVSAGQMLGSKFEARNRTGSAYYISPQEIQRMGYTDINRLLKSVPGVNVYEEDGYGLRPNISLRGTKAERSERISLMEDGIPIAPAPYASPAAYYFPNVARMYAIEVLKGSSQVQYGPFTTGGAINLVSTPIPKKFTARLNASFGSFATGKAYALVGNGGKYGGWLVEYLHYRSNGFRHAQGHEEMGFRRHDLNAKFLLQTANEEGVNHRFTFRFGYAQEHSDETYLGLSEADFAHSPYLRYPAAQRDDLTTRHQQWAATYVLDGGYRWKVTTQLYYNRFFRNWYKLNDVRTGVWSGQKHSIGDVLADPDMLSEAFALVQGTKSYDGEAMMLRANHRLYHSRGVQTKGEWKMPLWEGVLSGEIGIRYHEDDEARFQQDDGYRMVNQHMSLFLAGLPGSQSNSLTTARAWSGYSLLKWVRGPLTLTAGARYEAVSLLKKNYTKVDPRRSGKVRQETPNSAHAWLPGVGINLKLLPSLSLIGGAHRGFAPPGAVWLQEAEHSTNLESGLRWTTQQCKIEAIGFYNRYDHMLGSDLLAAGGQGTLEQFNVGKATVGGVEFMAQAQPRWGKAQFPLQLSYTYTHTRMDNEFSSGAWGFVHAGDEIPYIFRHAANANFGVQLPSWELNFGIRYNGDMRTIPGQGKIAQRERIPAHYIVDASAKYRISKSVMLSLNGINLLNARYLASRHPSGLRAGHPLGVYFGVDVRL